MPPSGTLTDHNGRLVTLGQKLGEGGEGAVYSVNSDTVAKIYLPGSRSAEQFAKVDAMTRIANPSFSGVAAWPIHLVYEHKQPVGFTMPKLASLKVIHQLFGPKERKANFPDATWRFLIRASTNLARAFVLLHENNVIVGDVNCNNVVIYPDATAHLIDCDSFQIRSGSNIFRCKVGMAEYQPPEFQVGVDYGRADRTPAHDAFGLSVLIFQLLFVGKHPFSGVSPPNFTGAADQGTNIRDRRFFYNAELAKHGFSPPPGSLNLSALPDRIARMFLSAFCGQPADRPSAKQWRDSLADLEKHLIQCKANPGHQYASISGCPWCALDAVGSIYFIVPYVVTTNGRADPSIWQVIPNTRVEQLWSAIIPVIPPPILESPLRPALHAPITADPIPKAIRDQAGLHAIFFLIYAVVATAAFILLGAKWIAFILALVGWGILVSSRPDARSEMARRKAVQEGKDRALTASQQQWAALAKNAEFSRVRARYDSVRTELINQKATADENLKKLALETFLDKYLIYDAKIPNVATKTKATLLSFGIETALDLDAQKLSRIGTINVARQQALLNWRRDVERKFRMQPNPTIPPQALREFYGRISQQRQRLFGELSAGPQTLQTIAAQTISQRESIRLKIDSEYMQLEQARQDVLAMSQFALRVFCKMS